MSEPKTKRARGKNFTTAERNLMVALAKRHRTAIENKLTDKVSVDMKTREWEKIQQEFTACSKDRIARTAGQLRALYDGMCLAAKKRAATNPETTDSGGDSYNEQADALLDKADRLLEICLTPPQHSFEKDALYNGESSEYIGDNSQMQVIETWDLAEDKTTEDLFDASQSSSTSVPHLVIHPEPSTSSTSSDQLNGKQNSFFAPRRRPPMPYKKSSDDRADTAQSIRRCALAKKLLYRHLRKLNFREYDVRLEKINLEREEIRERMAATALEHQARMRKLKLEQDEIQARIAVLAVQKKIAQAQYSSAVHGLERERSEF